MAIVSVIVGGSMRNAGSPTFDPASGHTHAAEVTRSGVIRYLDDREAAVLKGTKVTALSGLAMLVLSVVVYRVRFKRWPFR